MSTCTHCGEDLEDPDAEWHRKCFLKVLAAASVSGAADAYRTLPNE